MSLRPIYKNMIDEKLDYIGPKSQINTVYGGRTEETLATRWGQHMANPEFSDMGIEKIFESDKESELAQIKLAESYLIQRLKKKYGDKCLNKYMRGGGHQHDDGDVHKLYVMIG
jgi:hypothetical protein